MRQLAVELLGDIPATVVTADLRLHQQVTVGGAACGEVRCGRHDTLADGRLPETTAPPGAFFSRPGGSLFDAHRHRRRVFGQGACRRSSHCHRSRIWAKAASSLRPPSNCLRPSMLASGSARGCRVGPTANELRRIQATQFPSRMPGPRVFSLRANPVPQKCGRRLDDQPVVRCRIGVDRIRTTVHRIHTASSVKNDSRWDLSR